MAKQMLQFKITLNDVEPKVWRRIRVPDDYAFWDLHCAIQDSMGWLNCHLHGYFMSNGRRGPIRPTRIQMPNPEWDSKGDLDESKERLADWFPKRLKQCVYTYDFGDAWDHTVLFERQAVAEKGKKHPACVAGANACPPEDCGGAGGYNDLLAVINDPRSPRGQEMREWLGLEQGERYDPSLFVREDVIFENPKRLLKEYLREQELQA